MGYYGAVFAIIGKRRAEVRAGSGIGGRASGKEEGRITTSGNGSAGGEIRGTTLFFKFCPFNIIVHARNVCFDFSSFTSFTALVFKD